MIGHPLKVQELLEEIGRSEILLPEIQRSYVWKGPQVTQLLDSLYKEYPSGQILLWDTELIPVTKRMRGVSAPTEAASFRPKIVLDGQQRLTSLYKALGDGDDRVEVFFNLKTEEFQRYSNRMKGDPFWIPVRSVVRAEKHDLEILQGIVTGGGLTLGDPKSQTYLDRLQRLKRIGQYKYPIEIFKSDDYEEVTELFVRINAGGTRLRAAELALAQLALRLPGTLVETFEAAIDEYEDAGYELDARFLIRALIAVGTGQSRFRYLTDFWKKAPEDIERIWKITRKGIDAAVNFVRHNARFETSEWLPSLNALIPLTAFFARTERITHDVEVGLLRWFYIVSLRARYSTSPETNMDEDLRTVMGNGSVAALLKNAVPAGGPVAVSPDELENAGQRNPIFPMTYAVARKRGAKDWFRGVTISTDALGEDNKIHIHHIFPKALLRKAGVKRSDIDEIANLSFLAAKPNRQISNKPPDVYLTEIADKHADRLEAQSIPMDRSLWKLSQFHSFLAERRALLAEAVDSLISSPE